MIFKRRQKRSFARKVRDVFVPRKGWRRGFEYIGQRLKRLPDSPHNISLGFACGVFASFTPFFGVHFILAALAAWALRANILASAFGTMVGNPLTIPLIATLSLKIGDWILYSQDMSQTRPFTMAIVFEEPSYFWREILLPYTVGGVGPAILCSFVAYTLLFGIIGSYQMRKRARLKKAAAKRLALYNRAYNIGQHKNTQKPIQNTSSDVENNNSPSTCNV